MIQLTNTALVLVLLSVLACFGTGRITLMIKMVGLQGILISLLPLAMGNQPTTGTIIYTAAVLLIRGIVIPGAILIAIKKVAIRRGVQPIVGPHVSLLAALLLIVAAFYVSARVTLPIPPQNTILFPTAITLLVAGMFILMTRRNAIAMVLGYIIMENGIYLGGGVFSTRAHHIVELGILLDVLAGVMLMGVILQNINRTLDDVDTSLLRSLKD
jgi:hydrogenase-4 component E